ncbi:MAG: exosortase-associated EpsI family protein [Nitrosomonas sp.]|nr:MAG: exosortase-associated EpsI family protein [Nitrosomonas sp.]
MQNERRQLFLWIGLGVAVLMGILWQFIPLQDAKQRINALPLYGSGFIGRDVPLSGWEVDFFKNVNVLKRVYRVGKQNLFITALDGTRNRHVVHDPLYCFRGGGWEVISQQSLPIADGGTIAFVKLKKDKIEQDALYWFSDGKTHYDSPLRYWWQATLRRLTLGASGAEPVLVVVQPLDDVPLNWKKLVQLFPQVLDL